MHSQIFVELPFPPKELSPNSRLHWATVSRAKRKYRSTAGMLSKLASRDFKAEGRQRLDFTFYPPQNRAYDRDNLIARMKAAIDGIADGLGVNDKLFDIGNIDIAPKVPGGSVRVHITAVGKV